MFEMIDLYSKNAYVYCFLDNHAKESFLPIIKNDIFTCDDIKASNFLILHKFFTIIAFQLEYILIFGGSANQRILKKWDFYSIS